MQDKCKRRQNTNGWWRGHIEKQIEKGENLRAHDKFRSLESLKGHRDDIDNWLREAASEIRTIYEERSIVEEYCQPVGCVDFDNQSRSKVAMCLDSIIDRRLKGFRELIECTRP